jgi:hypothetical protein
LKAASLVKVLAVDAQGFDSHGTGEEPTGSIVEDVTYWQLKVHHSESTILTTAWHWPSGTQNVLNGPAASNSTTARAAAAEVQAKSMNQLQLGSISSAIKAPLKR